VGVTGLIVERRKKRGTLATISENGRISSSDLVLARKRSSKASEGGKAGDGGTGVETLPDFVGRTGRQPKEDV